MKCKCGCGKEIILKPYHKWYGVPKYFRGHSSKVHNNNPGFVKFGIDNPMYNSNLFGEKNHNYIDGCGEQRSHAKRKRELGYTTLNEKFKDSHGHHIDKEHVLFIPEELHKSIAHNNFTGKGMLEINMAAAIWYSREICQTIKIIQQEN